MREYPDGPWPPTCSGTRARSTPTSTRRTRPTGTRWTTSSARPGIEQTFESELRGKPELKKVEVDNRGIKIGESVTRKAEPGHDVQLTIDLGVQRVAEDSLAGHGRRPPPDRPRPRRYYEATGGAVVVLDARTGAVVALSSTPRFDPNGSSAGGLPPEYFDPNGPLPLIDRALNPYAPGSTFKTSRRWPRCSTGIRTADEPYLDAGLLRVRERRGAVQRGGRSRYGRVDLPRALTVSSDVYFYNVGQRVLERLPRRGRRRRGRAPAGYAIQHVARAFGFGAPTGIGLGGDQSGRIPDHEFRQEFNKNAADPTDRPGARGDSASLAVGQGDVLVTPLQLANGYAAFANGGTLYSPHLVAADPRQQRRAAAGRAREAAHGRHRARAADHRPHPRGARAHRCRARRRGERAARAPRTARSTTTRACPSSARPVPPSASRQAGHVVVRRHHQPGERPGAAAVRGRRDGGAGRLRRRRRRADRPPGHRLPERQPDPTPVRTEPAHR